MVFNLYFQKENLSLLSVFRNYDLDFDNPYQRSISNYRRYKGTIFEDYFRLEDPVYGLLYQNAAQPQAERGFYTSARYRFADPFIAAVEWDTWRRQGDMSKYSRMVLKLEYRILFPLRLKLRQKFQNRELGNVMDPTIFDNNERIWELQYRLSRFDDLRFRYGTAYVHWPPRGRLQGEPEANGSNPIVGNNANQGKWWSARFTHNSRSRRLKFDAEVILHEGFWWYFEKNTFRIVDSPNGFRVWAEITDRVSDDLTLRLRMIRADEKRNTGIDVRQFNEEIGDPVDHDNVRQVRNYYRFQLDYTY